MSIPIEDAVKKLGGPVSAARVLSVGVGEDDGVTYQAVQKWCRRGQAPAKRCIKIELATGGDVSRYDLRPDIFGAPAGK